MNKKLTIPDDWNSDFLGKLASISTGSKNTQDKVYDGKYPFFVRSQTVERINTYSFDGEAILTAGDGVGTGKVFHYINGKFDFHQRVYKISDFKEQLFPGYFFEYFRRNFIRQVVKYTAKTSVDSVRMEMLTQMEIPLPPLEEQKKIAQILSTWDEAIDAVDELIEKKKDQKKVLAEELFSGSKRLIKGSSKTQKTKYGDIPTDWEFLPISKVAKINRKSLGKENKYKSYKYVDLSSVNEGLISIPDEEITYEELPSRAKRIIQKGDVIFSTVRPNLLGYSIVDFDTSNHLCSTGFAVITPSVDSDTNFIYQQLYSSLFQRQVFSKVTGSNYPAINSSDFSNIKLNWPSDKNERKEIGDLLSGIELEAQLLYKKRQLLEKQKKGLMQRLLTGKVRVN